MKTLRESIINERISNREFNDIKGYVKGWVSECLTYTDYLDVINAIRIGIEEAMADNKKYFTKDFRGGKPLEDTNEFYLDIQQPLLDLKQVAINNAKRK